MDVNSWNSPRYWLDFDCTIMDFDIGDFEVNPFALMMGIGAALITVIMFSVAGKFSSAYHLDLIWKVLTPIVTFIVAYVYIDRTS